MAGDVKNIAAGDTGSAKNGSITIRGSRSNFQYQDALGGNYEYAISKFDADFSGTTDPTDATDLRDRFDDPRYYTGDAAT